MEPDPGRPTRAASTASAARNDELAARTLSDPRWTKVLARDPKADGSFVYSVRTTGVY